MKKKIKILTLFILLFISTLLLFGGADAGGETFISKCGQCHKSGGEAPVFAPNKYASKQWKRFFARNKHKRKKDISGIVTADDVKKIQEYLIDHAADSSQPEAAGLK